MSRLRRTFTPEFKREAAGLVLDQGYSLTEAARSLDLVESALRRWVNQLQSERGGATPTSKALTPEEQQIQELEARINRLEREKSILKRLPRFDGRGTRALALIDQLRREEPVELLCLEFEVTRSCYYAHCHKRRSPDVARLALRVRVNELFTQSRSAAGKPKEMVGETNATKVLMHSANALMLLCLRLALMMQKCLVHKQITFRGGISTGYCDISDSFAVGAGLSAANEAEGRAKFARLALADDVIRNEELMKAVRRLFERMYGDSEFLVVDKGVTYVNVLGLLLAGTDTKTLTVRNAMGSYEARAAIMDMRTQYEEYLTAQKKLVIESIREFWATYRKNYSDTTLRAVNRGVLKKYFWLRQHHNATAKKRRYTDFLIRSS